METQSDLDQNLIPDADFLSGRSKTALRLTYEAEVRVFRSKYGGLEEIRKNLGFSRRKMCQILMVDPSAWTRWMRDESKVPPHIYRALEWYLALEKKLIHEPELAAILLKGRSRPDLELGELNAKLEQQGRALEKLKKVVFFMTLGLFALVFAFFSRG